MRFLPLLHWLDVYVAYAALAYELHESLLIPSHFPASALAASPNVIDLICT